MTNEVFLCFDHGEKRIGVAVGQSLTATATPLETIACKHRKPDWQRISRLVEQWRPAAFVVGKPLTMTGARQPATLAAETFARQLHGRYLLPVHFADERLSSHAARQEIEDTYSVDPVAARLILESWLAERALQKRNATMP